MTSFAVYTTLVFSVLTIGAHFLSALIIIALIFRNNYFSRRMLPLVRHYAIPLGFFVALGATIASLIYSEVIGFEPCVLCWVQRVFIYPQVLLFGIALWKRDHDVVDYSIFLSVIGGMVALYQSYVQLGGASFTACTADGGSCAKVFFVEFGYVNLPVMSFTAFLLIFLFMIVKKVYRD